MSQGILDNLINELTRLPGIGRKTASRLAFFILSMPAEEAGTLAQAIREVKEKAMFCRECFNIASSELCPVCSDGARDRSKICVVEEPSNIIVFERTNLYRGLYHVLLGTLSPMDGITPQKLKIGELIERIKALGVSEVILATNPNTKGELTARYIADVLRPLKVTVSRIAYGLPMGGDIEFADEVTLGKSLEGRRSMQ